EAKRARESSDTEYNVACTVEPANFNAPGQVVVSGSVDAVTELEKIITGKAIRGVMVKRLSVSAPFHSSLMKPAREVMDKIFAQAKAKGLLGELSTCYIPNRTAKMTQEKGVIFPLLSEQVDHSVLWKQSVEHLIENEITLAFEFGPGKVLQGLAKRIAKNKEAKFETVPVYDLESLKVAQGMMKS
ncbi:MAG: ACP S-malonyltransferase, partial [Bdellovibrionales bacterium]|nr:ACP S-malonyltransferase [Oligoflexia bacterium]